MLASIVAVLLVVASAGYVFVSSRRLTFRLDDPLFPDLLLAHSQRVGLVVGSAIGIGIVLAHEHMGVVFIGLLVAVTVAGFPARKTIYQETWSLGSYLAHSARFWFALFGFFFILGFTPAAMNAAGELAFETGVALGMVAMLWAAFYSSWVPKVLRAKRLERAHLEPGIDAVVSKSRAVSPTIYEASAPGGTFVNAFALPAWNRPAVVFTTDLLDSLDDEETKAIFAHEVAHLEHHDRRATLFGLVASLVLVAIPIGLFSGPLAPTLRDWAWVWPLVLAFGLLAKLQQHRAHESESDVRAVELAGNPEALISALTKIHTLLRLSRRWSEQFEQRSTHPSLARRIHAIRRAAGGHSVEPFDPIVVVSSSGDGRAVVLDAERLHALSGIPAGIPEADDPDGEALRAQSRERRSIDYADIRDLMLHEHELVFTTSEGRSERMPVSQRDIPRLNEVLDEVDSLIAYQPNLHEVSKGRLTSLALALLGLLPPYSLVLFVLGVVACAAPAAITHAALGAAAVTTALAYSVRPTAWALSFTPLYIIVTAGIGVVVAWLAIKRYRRNIEATERQRAAAIVTGIVLVVLSWSALVQVVGSDLPWMQAHVWARAHPGAFVSIAGLSAMLWTIRRRSTRVAALGALGVGCIVFAIGSLEFRERFTDDVFHLRAGDVATGSVALTEIRSFEVDGSVSRVVLAPDGRSVALLISDDGYYYQQREGRYRIETTAGEMVELEALALEYANESEIVVLDRDDDVLRLRVARPESIATAEPILLTPLMSPELHVDAQDPVWRVIGESIDETMWVVASNRFDYDYLYETFLRYDEIGVPSYTLGPRGYALRQVYRYSAWDDSVRSSMLTALWTSWAGAAPVTELSLRRTREEDLVLGRTALSTQCFHTAESHGAFVCATYEDDSTTFWKLEPPENEFEPVGTFTGFYYGSDIGSSAEVIVEQWAGTPRLVDLSQRRAWLPTLPTPETEPSSAVEQFLYGYDRDTTDWGTLAWRGDVLARARADYESGHTTVTLYRIRGR